MEAFIGNRKIIEAVRRALQRSHIARVFLFSGPPDVGMRTAARGFAAQLLRISLDTLKRGAHPDALVVGRESKDAQGSLGIAQARAVRRFLSQSPLISDQKVVIIDGVEMLTHEAANALLKILEEPPETATLFLLTHEPSRVLPTIRSRAILVRFSEVSDQELSEGLESLGYAHEYIKQVLPYAEGKPGFALQLLRDREFFRAVRERRERSREILMQNRFDRFAVCAALERSDALALRALPHAWLRVGRELLVTDLKKIQEPLWLTGFLRTCYDIDDMLRTTNVQPSFALTKLLSALPSFRPPMALR